MNTQKDNKGKPNSGKSRGKLGRLEDKNIDQTKPDAISKVGHSDTKKAKKGKMQDVEQAVEEKVDKKYSGMLSHKSIAIFISIISLGVVFATYLATRKRDDKSDVIQNKTDQVSNIKDAPILQITNLRVLKFAPNLPVTLAYDVKNLGGFTARLLETQRVIGVTADSMHYAQIELDTHGKHAPTIVYIDKEGLKDVGITSPRILTRGLYDAVMNHGFKLELIGFMKYENMINQETKRYYFRIQFIDRLTKYQYTDNRIVSGDSILGF